MTERKRPTRSNVRAEIDDLREEMNADKPDVPGIVITHVKVPSVEEREADPDAESKVTRRIHAGFDENGEWSGETRNIADHSDEKE